MKRKATKKKADLNTKVGKYFLLRQKGIPKGEAIIQAGYSAPQQSVAVERTKTYQAIQQKYFKNELLEQIDMTQIASELRKNIVQDQDKGAKNKAIEIALDKIEPEVKHNDDVDKVLVILKQ